MAQLVDLMILLFLHFSFVVNDVVVVGVAAVAAAAVVASITDTGIDTRTCCCR